MCCPKQEPRSAAPSLVAAAVVAAVVFWPALVEAGRVAAVVVRLVLIGAVCALTAAAAAVAVGVGARRRGRVLAGSVRPARRVGARQPSTAVLDARLGGQVQAGAVLIPVDAEAGLYLLASPQTAARLNARREVPVEVPRAALPDAYLKAVGSGR